MHKLQSVFENETHEILDFEIQTDRSVSAKKP